MKITSLLLLVSFLHLSATTRSQTVSLNVKNQPISKVFETIERQTNLMVVYNDRFVDPSIEVSIHVKEASLTKVLETLLRPVSLTYLIKENTIVITEASRKKDSDLSGTSIAIQQRVVSGKVTDEQGNPLAGVTVVVKGTSSALTTDAAGDYRINVPEGGTLLVFSNVGFTSIERSIGNLGIINVTLSVAVSDIEEVVVVGYGKQRKSDVIGSVSTVGTEELTRTPVAQVSNMLAGRVPGLTAIQPSGVPGGDASALRIRGFGEPLVLIDNVEGNINTLDQNEIESITLLKDASAAVYGSRAGNGVILVTTKRGSGGAPAITFSQAAAFQSVTNMLTPASSGQNAELIREAHLQLGLPEETVRFRQEEVDLFYNGTNPDYPNTDWLDVVTRKHAPQQQYNLSVRGGTDKVKYYGFIGTLNQQSLFKDNGGEYLRYNLRSNVDVNISRDLDFRIDLSSAIENRNFPWRDNERENSVWVDFWNTEPFYPAQLPDPTRIPYANGAGTGGVHVTSNSDISGYRRTASQNLFGTMELNYRVPMVPGLSLRAFGNYRQDYSFAKVFERLVDTWVYNHESNIYTPMGGANNPRLTHYDSRSKVLTGQFYVNYNRKFQERHDVSGMLLYEVIDYASDNILAGRDNFVTPVVDYLFAGGVNAQRANGSASEMGRQSFVGRLNYGYDNRYLMETTLRIDESAKFSQEGRRGVFPSVSLGWHIGNEPFFAGARTFVDLLKYRLTFSQTGNDNVGNFQYLSGYNFGSTYVFGNQAQPGLVETGMANPLLTWEEMTIYNTGIDFRFKNGMIYGNIDAFYRLREKIPGSRWNSLPSTFGAALPTENINSTTSRGVEVMIGHEGRANDFLWDVKLNVGWNREKWKYYDEPEYEDADQARFARLTGRWTDVAFGYQSAGLFTSYEEIQALDYIYNEDTGNASLKPGDVRFLDTNGDGLLNWRDQVMIGNGTFPRWTGGLNLTLGYKGVDVSVLLQGAFAFYQHLNLKRGLVYPEIMYNERWSETNNRADALIPRLGGANSNTMGSDFNFIAADYLRVKTLSVGYQVDQRYLERFRIRGLRVHVSGLNLFTFSKLNQYDLDPEAPSGYGGYYYPQMKTMSFGVNLTL